MNIIERSLELHEGEVTPEIMPRVRSLFAGAKPVSTLLSVACRPEAKPLLRSTEATLAGVLRVLPEERWTADEAFASHRALSESPPSS